VQGVGYRYFVSRTAEPLGLVGTATNLRSGEVEVIAEGPRIACEQLLGAIRGPAAPGSVDGVDVSWGEPAGGLIGFRVR
jgi:acylphosphatase